MAIDASGSILDLLFPGAARDSFLRDHWTRKPLFLPSGAAALTEVLSWDDLQFLIANNRVPVHRVLLPSGDGTALPLDQYTERVGDTRRLLRAGEILRLLQEGRSLIVQELEHHHPPARALAGRLSRELGEPVHVGVFCSWPGKRVLPPHYDLHENLVIGLAGDKQWTLYEPFAPFPFEFDVAEEPPTAALLSTSIRRGDLLYIPRGCWHVTRASAGGGPSMHLTISVRCRPVERLLVQAAAECEGLAELGEPLRLALDRRRGGIGYDEAQLRRLAGALRDALVDRLSRPDFPARFNRAARAQFDGGNPLEPVSDRRAAPAPRLAAAEAM